MGLEKPQLIDLLEVFHGRQARAMAQAQLRRLRDDDNFLPGGDLQVRGNLIRHYQRLFEESVDLLRTLGDIQDADEPLLPDEASQQLAPGQDKLLPRKPGAC